jgi:hypothetical protein
MRPASQTFLRGQGGDGAVRRAADDLRPAGEAYADHYIAVHLSEVADGRTYSEVSGEFLTQCSDPKAAASADCQQLAGQKATLFQGETLRGLLLYGYAFATMGTVAGWAAIAALAGAVVLLILVFPGFRHGREARAAETSAEQPST